MIPSTNSKHIIFGEITSDVYIDIKSQTELDEGACPYNKKRDVKWLKSVPREKLDPYLYKMMNVHLTISNANDYADAIDRTIHSFYYKGDKAHLVLGVDQQDDIALVDLLDALSAPLELIDYIKNPKEPEQSFSKNDLDAKLRVQSPGIFEFVSTGQAFALAVLLGVVFVGLAGGKVGFRKTEEKIEGELETDGLLDKIFNFIKHKDEVKTKKEHDDINKKEMQNNLQPIQKKIMRSKENLDIQIPKELEGYFDNDSDN